MAKLPKVVENTIDALNSHGWCGQGHAYVHPYPGRPVHPNGPQEPTHIGLQAAVLMATGDDEVLSRWILQSVKTSRPTSKEHAITLLQTAKYPPNPYIAFLKTCPDARGRYSRITALPPDLRWEIEQVAPFFKIIKWDENSLAKMSDEKWKLLVEMAFG